MSGLLKLSAILWVIFIFPPSLAFASESIKIAAIYAMSGKIGEDNASSLEGVHLAVKDINAKGGVLGRKFELMAFDNQGTAIGSRLAAKRAAKDNVTAIVGGAWSSHTMVIARVAQANKIPMLSGTATHADITRIGKYIFRLCFTDDIQGKAISQFVRNDLKARSAAIVKCVTSDYSIGLAQAFRKDFENHKGRVILELNYLQKQEDFKTLLQQAKLEKPDILFIPGHYESALITCQAQEMGIKAYLIGGDGWSNPAFFSNGGLNLKLAYYSDHWSREIPNDKLNSYFIAHPNAKNVTSEFVLTYDAVSLLADAITRAGSTDREKVVKALSQTNGFLGLSGKITFDRNGNPNKDVVIMKIVNGKSYLVKSIGF